MDALLPRVIDLPRHTTRHCVDGRSLAFRSVDLVRHTAVLHVRVLDLHRQLLDSLLCRAALTLHKPDLLTHMDALLLDALLVLLAARDLNARVGQLQFIRVPLLCEGTEFTACRTQLLFNCGHARVGRLPPAFLLRKTFLQLAAVLHHRGHITLLLIHGF